MIRFLLTSSFLLPSHPLAAGRGQRAVDVSQPAERAAQVRVVEERRLLSQQVQSQQRVLHDPHYRTVRLEGRKEGRRK